MRVLLKSNNNVVLIKRASASNRELILTDMDDTKYVISYSSACEASMALLDLLHNGFLSVVG